MYKLLFIAISILGCSSAPTSSQDCEENEIPDFTCVTANGQTACTFVGCIYVEK